MKKPCPPFRFLVRHQHGVKGLAFAAALLFLAAAAALGQDLEPPLDSLEETVVTAKRSDGLRLKAYGSVRAEFTTSLVGPAFRKGANRFRLATPDHNSLNVSYATLGVSRTLSGLNEFDAGFTLELAAGRMVSEAFLDPLLGDDAVTVPQAFVDLQLPTLANALEIRLGRQYAWFGTESLDVSRNTMVSLSPLTFALPKTVTGLSLGMDLGSGLSYRQYVVQGWDVVDDPNAAKTLGGQLALESGKASFALNWILGAERLGASGLTGDNLRWVVEGTAELKLSLETELAANVVYGQEEFPDDTARFWGASATLTQRFLKVEDAGFHRLFLGLRASYLRDHLGSRTGVDQALGEFSATLGVNFTPDASLQIEYRHDHSSAKDTFLGSRLAVSRSHQDTLSLAFNYRF